MGDNMDYKFSVSMCVYGGDNPEHFEIALGSVFNQTLMPDEVVLVVDGPVPDTLNKVISKFEEYSIFKVIRLAQNVGHGNARRTGLEACSYEYVAIMDADDVCVNTRFEKQILAFKNNNDLTIVGGMIEEFINDISNVVGIRRVPQADSDIKDYMKKRCPMNQQTVMFKKSLVQAVGGYIDWYCDEDYYLWLRLALNKCKFMNINETLVYVRVGNEMYQRRGGYKYFKSEAKLQAFMLKNKVISLPRYCINVGERLILQVLMPNTIRGWVFKKFARDKAEV